MNRNNIHQYCLVKQGKDAMEKTYSYQELISLPYLFDKKFISTLHDVIREHGKYRHGEIYLDTSSSHVTNSEKRDLLRFLLESDDYDFVCEDTDNLNLLYDEKESLLQALADHEAPNVYHDAMIEGGMRAVVHPNNDEIYYVRRSI